VTMTVWNSIFGSTCPRCRKGKMFKHSIYTVSKMREMHKNCNRCGQYFKPEPMFYEGSMYVSYAFSVAIVVTVFVIFVVLYDKPNINVMMSIAIGLSVVLAPLNLRLSRMIWANFFIKYKSNAIEEHNKRKLS